MEEKSKMENEKNGFIKAIRRIIEANIKLEHYWFIKQSVPLTIEDLKNRK